MLGKLQTITTKIKLKNTWGWVGGMFSLLSISENTVSNDGSSVKVTELPSLHIN